jgi:hypothetical protein
VNAPDLLLRFRRSFVYTVWLLHLLLLAFGARLYALDARPLWWDEGLTLTFAYLPPRANAAFAVATADVNPPVYRWSVGALTALGGVSLFSTRLVSVYASLVVVAAAYALGRRALGSSPAAWALPLLALSPLQIYYAQEAKGYAFSAAAVLLNLIFWWDIQVQALVRPATTARHALISWAGYALSLLLALGANYLAVFGLILQNGFTLALSLRAFKRGVTPRALIHHWLRWLAIQLVGLLPLLPFVLLTFGATATGLSETSASETTLNPGSYTWRFLGSFAGGEASGNGWWLALVAALLALAAIGWFALGRAAGPRRTRAYLAAWLLGPLLLGYFFHLHYPWFYPRFLLFGQPALLLLAGAGLAALARWRGRATLILLLLLFGLHLSLLQHHYRAPARFAEDPAWPELFTAMRPYVRAGDGLIARYPWMPGYMYSYLPPAPTPTWILGFFARERLDDELQALLAHHGRVWQIDYQTTPWDPHNDSARWMRGRAALAYWQQVGPGSTSLFVAAGQLERLPTSESQVSRFANGIHVRWSPVRASAGPGEPVGLVPTWWTDRPQETHLIRFLHLVNADGTLLAQADAEPGMGARLTFEWQPHQPVADPVALMLPLALAPGFYELRLGLYDRGTLQRVLLADGEDYLVVGRVVVGADSATH